jgi:type I restriction enzyme S subunit
MAIEFHRDGPWELPEGWVWARLGQLGRWSGGGTPSKSNKAFWTGGSVPWISPKDMKVDIVGDSADRITEAAVKNSSTKLVPAYSVLMVIRSGILNHTFPVAVCDRKVTLNQDMRALIPFDGVDARYVSLICRRLQRHILEECSKDGTTVASVEPSRLEKVWIPLAPTAEQRRLVARIGELSTEISDGEASLTRARDDLNTWRSALLKAAVTGELTRGWRKQDATNESGAEMLANARLERDLAVARGNGRRLKLISPSDEIKLPTIPNNWAWGQLGDFLFGIEAGLNIKADGHPPRVGETGIVKISAVTWDEFNETESKTLPAHAQIDESDLIRPGDLLISRANTLELVGAPVIVKSCERRLVLSDKVLRLRVVSGLHRWIELCLKSPIGRLQIEHYASGNQLSMRNITQENIARLAIPVPPWNEIEKAIRIFEECNESRDDGRIAVEDANHTAASLRQSILKAAFEGHLIDQDPRDEPAERLLARLSKLANTPVLPRRTTKKRSTAVAAE